MSLWSRLPLAAFSLLLATPSFAAEPLPVTATFSLLGDLVKEVGGDKVKVTTLVGTDGDAHVYQPTPQDVQALSKAKVLGREDVGGKTGSTNDHRDAWFSGFGGPLATTVWVGRDDFKSLGYREYGGKAALPIWMSFMGAALNDKPAHAPAEPEGILSLRPDVLVGTEEMGPPPVLAQIRKAGVRVELFSSKAEVAAVDEKTILRTL